MLRETIHQRPGMTTAICAICVAGALSFVFARSDLFTSRSDNRLYYYDVNAGEIFPGPWAAHDADAPSGGERVIAYVYTCGDCTNTTDCFIAYLERIDGDSHQVASPAKTLQWVTPDSRAAVAIIDRVNTAGQCEMPRQCSP